MSFVEYHDPDGLYPLISKQLGDHLPLSNLHWSPPGRPVRSISALHIDLISAPTAPHVPNSNDDPSATAGRRHQLPGLRQSPFLKLFILRCDDKDVYKNSKRGQIQTWINELGLTLQTAKGSNRQDNHDAFEWLILHVVLPNTVASTEPRWTRESIGDVDLSKEKPSGGARWPGKRSRSLLEKLRADFNSSSKSAPDRVAQIRLRKDEVPLDTGPELPHRSATSYSETPKDRESAWLDLINKFKSLILRSFSLRVAQYEEDIHEKELQRSLPGWNFCLFFVLKEGLARVFESIGLIEDALRGYEELSAGLDLILDECSSSQDSAQSTSFQASTQEFEEILAQIQNGATSEFKNTFKGDALRFPLEPSRKNYRELIVANQISVFDFKCYIHSRKVTLMIRKAKRSTTTLPGNMPSSEISSVIDHNNSPDFVDTTALADICQFGMESIPYLARLLRRDLIQR